MKKIKENDVKHLFHFVTQYYPTKHIPNIVVLLLNREEWKRFHEERIATTPSIEQVKKSINERTDLPSDQREMSQRFLNLPEKVKEQLVKSEKTHFDSKEMDFDFWMTEVRGKTWAIEDLKERAWLVNEAIPPFFRPYANVDYVIIVSNFFDEREEKLRTGEIRRMGLYVTIIEELLHIVERCNGTKIFKQSTLKECFEITVPLAREYLARAHMPATT